MLFRGTTGAQRARQYAAGFRGACEVDGNTVIFTRETNIIPEGITLHEIFGPNVVPFGTNGHRQEPMPPRVKKRHMKRR